MHAKGTKQVRESAAVSDGAKISCVRKVGGPRMRLKIECVRNILDLHYQANCIVESCLHQVQCQHVKSFKNFESIFLCIFFHSLDGYTRMEQLVFTSMFAMATDLQSGDQVAQEIATRCQSCLSKWNGAAFSQKTAQQLSKAQAGYSLKKCRTWHDRGFIRPEGSAWRCIASEGRARRPDGSAIMPSPEGVIRVYNDCMQLQLSKFDFWTRHEHSA